jgi:Fe-S cluster biogenesis protein NfuA
MFIQTETTPNPLSLKFLPGKEVSPKSPINFTSKEDAIISPLAKALFLNPHVVSVFFGKDFITITKSENAEWEVIKPEILLTMMEHFTSGAPLIVETDGEHQDTKVLETDSEIVAQIKEIIEHRVRPAVAQDGGDIIFHSFENGIVKLELHGSCSGCPSSTITLKNGIENMLKHYVPEVESVEAIDNHEKEY